MPIFEYECRACGHEFERLVRAGDVPACPTCGSETLEKLHSLSAFSSAAARKANIQKARQVGRRINQEKEMAHLDEVREHYGVHGLDPAPPGPLRKPKGTSG
jgi:putative FmdB family regulatory protein